MGRNKLVMKKIENPISRQQFYSKRKDNIVKKANELAVLCDTNIALLMFSPTDQVATYSSRGSVEDTILHIMNQPGELNNRFIPNEQHLMQCLVKSKNEGEMVQKIAIAEAHEEKLNNLNQTLSEARQKLSKYYKPQVENINSVQEADVYQQFLMNAMEGIQRSKVTSVNTVDAVDAAAAGTSRG